MNDDLFTNIPPMLSPRLKWMHKYGITTTRKATSQGEVWSAEGLGCAVGGCITEDDALFRLAKHAQIRMWNELT